MRVHGVRMLWIGAGLWIVALGAGVLLVASTAPTPDPIPTPSPQNPLDRDKAEKAAAAARNTAPPAPPTPRRWSARTVAEVQANLLTDDNYAGAIAALTSGADPDPRAVGRATTVGTPLFVRGLAPGNADEYLVPVNVGGVTIAIIKVGVDTSGLGQIDAVRGWSTAATFPATAESAALTSAGTPADAAVKAELVWTEIRGLADELSPFWRLTRASGAVYFLFEDGKLMAASQAGY